MSIIVGLILLTLILITFEIIIPSGILGALAIIAGLGAATYAYFEFGFGGMVITLIITLIVSILTIMIEYKLFAKTKLGGKLFLQEKVEAKSTQAESDNSIVGKTGETLTPLAPTGMIFIDGRRYEAFSQGGFLDKGQKVSVTGVDNFRLIVKKS